MNIKPNAMFRSAKGATVIAPKAGLIEPDFLRLKELQERTVPMPRRTTTTGAISLSGESDNDLRDASRRLIECLLTIGLLGGTGIAQDRMSPLGSGFVVSNLGHVVTNSHVVSDCTEIAFAVKGLTVIARVLAVDKQNDLALLQADQKLPTSLRLRENSRVKLGETVLAFGYPLQGIATSSLQLTTGTVSGLAGLGDDSRFLQFTAPVQPGNSGGPLVDESGNVVGLVTSKLSALWAAHAISDVPQNVNFALKASLVADFLARNNVPFLESPSQTASRRPTTELADELGPAVVAVACRAEAKTSTAVQQPPMPAAAPSVAPASTAAPVSTREAVMAAKTMCIYQRNGNPVVSNEISGAIVKWGKLSVVSRPEQADLVLEVTLAGELNVWTGAGNQAAATLLHRQSGVHLWSETKGGSWAVSGWSNAWVGRSIAKDLVKFIESQRKAK